jgi:peroxiredoxin
VVSARIGGTPLNNDLQSYTDALGKFKPYQDSLSNRFRIAYRDKLSTDLSRLNKEFKVLDSVKRKAELENFSQKLNSVVSVEWLEKNINIAKDKSQAEKLFAKLSKNVQESAQGKAYAALLKKTASVSVGGTAPDFKVKTISEEDISLSAFKGKYVLLDFWASWCAPCRKENPNVLKAYNAFKDQNFTVVGFSMDESKVAWKKAVEADGMPWMQISDLRAWKGDVSKLYGIEGIPANFLIDPNGKIIARDLRGEKLEIELNRIFKKG